MSADATAVDVAARLDRMRLGPMHLLIAFLSAIGLFIDIGELSLNAAFATMLDRMTFVPAGAQSILLGSVFAGGIVGAPLCGILADRFGRRISLQASMFALAACSCAAAFCRDHWTLIGLRFLSGVALGAYPPLMTAWLTDILPPGRRAKVILLADAVGFLGAPALLFLVYRLNAAAPFGIEAWRVEGWRAALGAGGVIAAVCAAAFWLVPESPRWLAARGRLRPAEAALVWFERGSVRVGSGDELQRRSSQPPVASNASAATVETSGGHGLFSHALYGRAILIFVLYGLRAVPTVVFPVMMGLVLRRKGLDPNASLMLVMASSFGGSIGTLCGAAMIEWIERRTALVVSGALLIVCGLLFAATDDALLLLPTSAAFITLGAIYGPFLSIYSAEIMPTPVRAQATSIAWGLTRLMSSILPIALIPLLAGSGPWAFMGIVLGSIAISLVIVRGFGPAQPPSHPIV